MKEGKETPETVDDEKNKLNDEIIKLRYEITVLKEGKELVDIKKELEEEITKLKKGKETPEAVKEGIIKLREVFKNNVLSKKV